ncbi:hypothetical protein [Spirulina sp. 06S082]|uniref:competence protein CoiA family protein n=1 Tax=Spirulina sp. 06S082 TaxID=3110248 RepID=UPI002B20C0A7|nr:hypothetical protein [Spirulina sp. 06S082]MEA5468477.1 hypothetical protein [Spirulina sp. 06S082]
MDFAKAMYLGGDIVHARDERLNYQSYKELGLVCPHCNQEILLRCGEWNRPHFAHFKATNLSSRCELRVANSYGYSGWSSFFSPEDKGQKRKIFEQYFLKIIGSEQIKFEEKINFVKSKIFDSNAVDLIIQCSEFFCENRSRLITECREVAGKQNELLLRSLIAAEAIKYLCVSSSIHLLEQLIYYSLFCCNPEPGNWRNFFRTVQLIPITQKIKEIILETHWESAIPNLVWKRAYKHRSNNHQIFVPSKGIDNINEEQIYWQLKKYFFPENKHFSDSFILAPFAERVKLRIQKLDILLLKDVLGIYPITKIAKISEIKSKIHENGRKRVTININFVIDQIFMDKITKKISDSIFSFYKKNFILLLRKYLNSYKKDKKTLLILEFNENSMVSLENKIKAIYAERENRRIEIEKQKEKERAEIEKQKEKERAEIKKQKEKIKFDLLQMSFNPQSRKRVSCFCCKTLLTECNLVKHIFKVHKNEYEKFLK